MSYPLICFQPGYSRGLAIRLVIWCCGLVLLNDLDYLVSLLGLLSFQLPHLQLCHHYVFQYYAFLFSQLHWTRLCTIARLDESIWALNGHHVIVFFLLDQSQVSLPNNDINSFPIFPSMALDDNLVVVLFPGLAQVHCLAFHQLHLVAPLYR